MIPHYVLIIHGIGSEKEGFSGSLPEKITEVFQTTAGRFSPQPPQGAIDIREAVWSGVTQADQRKLWGRLFPNPDNWIPRVRYWALLRKYVVDYIGDMIAYVETPGVNKYRDIHQKFFQIMDGCTQDAGNRGATAQKPALLTVVAHSLGSVIAADAIHNRIDSQTWPAQLQLANLITLGSPLALYALRFGDPDNFSRPITMQDPDGLWINIYDPQDIVGHPLKLVNRQYDQAVDIDKVINAGQGWKFWQWIKQASPFSHLLYWEDNTVAEVIGRKAALDWLRENQPELGSRLQQEYAKYKSWLS